MSFLILSAGCDAELLKSRNTALVALGYGVAAASDSLEIVDKLLDGDFDLVLLCHTIPDEDRLRVARIVAGYTPSTPVVLVSEDGRCRGPDRAVPVRANHEHFDSFTRTRLET